jgi:two-component system sensor histidine kinase TorS
MDVNLPGLSGTEATRRLRVLPEGRDLPVIGISAHVQDEEVAEQLDAGMDCFVAKPVSPERLAAAIAQVTGGQRRGVFLSPRSALRGTGRARDVLGGMLADLGPEQTIAAIRLYLDGVAEEGRVLAAAVAAEDAARAAKVAHRMKGAAGNFSLPGLSAALRAVEEAARAGDAAGMRAGMADLPGEIAAARATLLRAVEGLMPQSRVAVST